MRWFEESPAISLDLIHATRVKADAPIIDIGGGASRLVDASAGPRPGLSCVQVMPDTAHDPTSVATPPEMVGFRWAKRQSPFTAVAPSISLG